MLRYIIVRTIWIFVVLVTFLSLLFITIQLVPEYPPNEVDARNSYYADLASKGYYTVEIISDPDIVQQIRNDEYQRCSGCYYRSDGDVYRVYVPVPIITQYGIWARNILLRWDWGKSTRIAVNVDVFRIIEQRLPITMRINFLALLVFMPVGFFLGILAALRKNKLTDNIISLGVMIFISVPSFVVMLFLVMLIAFNVSWIPATYPSADVRGAVQYYALILPVAGISLGAIAGLTRLTRAELTEVLTSEFLLLARTKGLTRSQAVIRHAMRNSMVPLVPTIIFSFVSLLSGSVIIERIYAIPGMGRVYLQALTPNNFDYNLILALSAFYTFISLFAVLLVDLTYGLVDPRIRMGARK
ncbi:MAG: ABC transporter permease [Candidatus Izemoplasmataceae bacterium]|jgi:oligopeptide transport system permease protein|uniref:ABC transporter permease n=1 Tax=Liberiplasma polymorphum TaxID=3374570 RepID=UPI0037756C05